MIALVPTDDGSLTCRHPATGELYHNRAGAYAEALRNYYQPAGALDRLQSQKSLHVLDACFGLGYNSLVMLEQLLSVSATGTISVVGIEIDAEILGLLPAVLADSRLAKVKLAFAGNLPAGFGTFGFCKDGLSVNLEIRRQDLRGFLRLLPEEQLDLIFHDPFSPAKMPELWTRDIFDRYYQLLERKKGKLLTYSSAYAVRGGLLQAGFQIFRTEALGYKSGGTLATTEPTFVCTRHLFDLTDEERAGIQSRSGVPYRDAGLQNFRQDILRNRRQEQAQLEINSRS